VPGVEGRETATIRRDPFRDIIFFFFPFIRPEEHTSSNPAGAFPGRASPFLLLGDRKPFERGGQTPTFDGKKVTDSSLPEERK